MTRLTGRLKFDWTNPNTYPDELSSDPYSPVNPNAFESDPNIPLLYDEIPTRNELMVPDMPVAPSVPEWGPKEPIRNLNSWPPKTPIEAPPPDRPPMWFFGPTPSQIARADAAGKVNGNINNTSFELPTPQQSSSLSSSEWSFPASNGVRGLAGAGPLASQRMAPQPALPVQNLTTHVLRMKGVPEADIGAAINDPATMQALLNQLYGRRSMIAPDDSSGGFGNPFGQAASAVQPDQASTPTAATPGSYLPFGWAGLQTLLR
jgi:hypothetical protein